MNIAPEKFGISSRLLEKILRELDENEVPIHSLLIARGDDIVFDAYWAPFTRDTRHRMNSVTKSFVALAIGCLIDEGKLSLDSRAVEFFPEAKDFKLNKHQSELTIENMLTMRTGYRPIDNGHWVRDRKYNRIKTFFERELYCGIESANRTACRLSVAVCALLEVNVSVYVYGVKNIAADLSYLVCGV